MKLELCRELRELVIERLGQDHSPQQIAGWLRLQYPDNEQMQVSHETIYRALYVQARGSLARELTRHLRTGRQKRYARTHSNRGQGLGKFPDMVMIAERPPEVEDRAVPGHWEGDLLMGNRDTAIATLVERQTRYCQLVALPQGTNAEPVCEALKQSIMTLPEQLRRSLTWDQGKEMAEHRRFSVETGVEVYFCDPRSPWQRGSNENTNGLLRQYFPKGKSLAGVTQAELDRGRPQAQRPPPPNARVPDPRPTTHRADRRAPHRRVRALISLRPTAFARQRPDRMRRCGRSGVVHRPVEAKSAGGHLADASRRPCLARNPHVLWPGPLPKPPGQIAKFGGSVPDDAEQRCLELRQLGLAHFVGDLGTDPTKNLGAQSEHLVTPRGALEQYRALIFGVGDAANIPEALEVRDGLGRSLLADPETASELGHRDALLADRLQREPMDRTRRRMTGRG